MNHSEIFLALKPYLEKKRELRNLVNVLYYDLATTAPEKALETQGEIMNKYDAEFAAISTDEEYKKLVAKGLADKSLSKEEQRLFSYLNEEIDLMNKMSIEDYTAYKNANVKSNEMWRLYRAQNDFASWLPYWEECVSWSRKIAKLKMKEGMKTPYDALLDAYEPGNTSEYLDKLFAPIKETIVKLLPIVLERQKKTVLPPIKEYSQRLQEDLSYSLLDLICYDMKRGVLRVSAHPFSADVAQYDSRLTTRYDLKDWRNNLFTILHEGGHCLEFQNKGEKMYEDYLEYVASAAQCETHSRLIENIFGRSKEFAPILKERCAQNLGKDFNSISDEDFYLMLNEVKPSLIRCDADELTYSLHIIIRYEIERDLINGVIECKDVPTIWNKKYKDYLDIDVPTDKDGCMQDVHWTDGEFGYFPSYLLGNLYGAMIFERMDKEIHAFEKVKNNDFKAIVNWLAENDYQYDWMRPDDWIKKVVGKPLSSDAFIRYLTNKYGK